MNSQNSPSTYIPMLTSAGYKPTKPGTNNQFAKFDPIAGESQVIYLSHFGGWRIYDSQGEQIGHGDTLWQLKGCIL